MKIALQNPPLIEMSRNQICEHFDISYPTLRKVTNPVKDITDIHKLRVFKGDDLKLVYTLVYNYQLYGALKELFCEEKLTKNQLKRLIA
jgi:hypothetical protein